jgi:hypothetical protein
LRVVLEMRRLKERRSSSSLEMLGFEDLLEAGGRIAAGVAVAGAVAVWEGRLGRGSRSGRKGDVLLMMMMVEGMLVWVMWGLMLLLRGEERGEMGLLLLKEEERLLLLEQTRIGGERSSATARRRSVTSRDGRMGRGRIGTEVVIVVVVIGRRLTEMRRNVVWIHRWERDGRRHRLGGSSNGGHRDGWGDERRGLLGGGQRGRQRRQMGLGGRCELMRRWEGGRSGSVSREGSRRRRGKRVEVWGGRRLHKRREGKESNRVVSDRDRSTTGLFNDGETMH